MLWRICLGHYSFYKGGGHMENSLASREWIDSNPLTIIDIGKVHFCLEYRSVEVCGQEVELTTKEFDILALLIMNPRRVFTYEMIMDLVWHEEYDIYARRTIINHISNLRKKLMSVPGVPNYIRSVHSVGYKFNE